MPEDQLCHGVAPVYSKTDNGIRLDLLVHEEINYNIKRNLVNKL